MPPKKNDKKLIEGCMMLANQRFGLQLCLENTLSDLGFDPKHIEVMVDLARKRDIENYNRLLKTRSS